MHYVIYDTIWLLRYINLKLDFVGYSNTEMANKCSTKNLKAFKFSDFLNVLAKVLHLKSGSDSMCELLTTNNLGSLEFDHCDYIWLGLNSFTSYISELKLDGRNCYLYGIKDQHWPAYEALSSILKSQMSY